MSARAQQYATQARQKIQGVISSIRSMTVEEDGTIRKVPETLVTPWENAMRTMFGSCTTGMPEDVVSPVASNSSRSSKSRSFCEPAEPASPSREKEEFFYSQFLHNDHSRAEQAVSTVREHSEKNPQHMRSPKKGVPKPFPVSTPPRKEQKVPPILVQEICPPTNRHGEITSNMSFDDGISCISAHTLEEMAARHVDQRRLHLAASDVTSEGFETIDSKASSSIFSPTLHSPERINEDNCQFGSPIQLDRKISKRSTGTKSTRSTKSSESFEHKWRRDEQQYWQDVVDQDETDMGTPEKRREIMLQRVEALKSRSRSRDASDSPEQLKQNNTTSTTGSSFSGSPFSKHPHETFPFEAHDILNMTVEEDEGEVITTKVLHGSHLGRNDPDRLQEILVLDHDTELGEI
mmetsp:Transcript_21850/g.36084  ORF Transcript_21850/g.36084 Transcript_21850/m.36084 type:complete len:406 (+) Transcript_21850:142-1359(+)|eukprot:CAMPEP_0119006946 /NCGR_PEP_ID=MMETSP1176-20130426/2651_1 /TAXON_ID=265551 /ORGANISM="Synedropsis recta cf, Strain CCMP1620" /LENGTH=405 /DNA_ID=CAMNT_0006958983 /DNA_START=122 /DNA_END=1339 /DNA_ORIENTATION=+